jgi:hypothetical protein
LKQKSVTRLYVPAAELIKRVSHRGRSKVAEMALTAEKQKVETSQAHGQE